MLIHIQHKIEQHPSTNKRTQIQIITTQMISTTSRHTQELAIAESSIQLDLDLSCFEEPTLRGRDHPSKREDDEIVLLTIDVKPASDFKCR